MDDKNESENNSQGNGANNASVIQYEKYNQKQIN